LQEYFVLELENILQGLETGADDYIIKPFNTKILIARIKNLIDIRSQLQLNINREMTLQPVKTSVSKIDQAFFHDLHEVINKNLSDEEFYVEQLCKKLYMGRTTLYRKVLALTGEEANVSLTSRLLIFLASLFLFFP
jgi:DNA-binding response OmpR family regulator